MPAFSLANLLLRDQCHGFSCLSAGGNKDLQNRPGRGGRSLVQYHEENANMKKPVQKVFIIVSALTVLGGCVAVPVQPGYYEPPVVYVPAPVYYGPPAYYGPSISFGFYGGRGGYGGRRGHGHHH
jgi:hypothetical protein